MPKKNGHLQKIKIPKSNFQIMFKIICFFLMKNTSHSIVCKNTWKEEDFFL